MDQLRSIPLFRLIVDGRMGIKHDILAFCFGMKCSEWQGQIDGGERQRDTCSSYYYHIANNYQITEVGINVCAVYLKIVKNLVITQPTLKSTLHQKS